MNRKMVVMTIVCIIVVYLLYSSVQMIFRGSPEITYEVLKYEELPEEVLIKLDSYEYNIFEDTVSFTTFKVRIEKDTYIFLKPPKGLTAKVLEVKIDEIWFNTLEYKFTTYGEEGVDIRNATGIIKVSNFLGNIKGISSYGE